MKVAVRVDAVGQLSLRAVPPRPSSLALTCLCPPVCFSPFLFSASLYLRLLGLLPSLYFNTEQLHGIMDFSHLKGRTQIIQRTSNIFYQLYNFTLSDLFRLSRNSTLRLTHHDSRRCK